MKKKWVLLLLSYTATVSAFSWSDLWLREDQQALRLLKQGKAQEAEKLFTDPQWRAAAHYRAGHYEQAAQQYTQEKTADANYNRGNALALQGDYKQALDAYEQALKKNPQHADAAYNRDVIKKLMRQQSQQQAASQQQNSHQQKQQDSAAAAQQSKEQQTASAQQEPQKPSPQNATPSTSAQKAQAESEKTKESAASEQAQAKQQKAADEKSAEAGAAAKDKPQAPKERAPAHVPPTETQQANEQWLQQIPDDPGGLLRQKFLRDHEKHQTRG